MPFNSTTHFHTMVALEQAKINPADVQILNMPHPEVRAAWQRGDMLHLGSGACPRRRRAPGDPLTSAQDLGRHRQGDVRRLCRQSRLGEGEQGLHGEVRRGARGSDDNYRKNKAKFTKDSPEVKAIAKDGVRSPRTSRAASRCTHSRVPRTRRRSGSAAARTRLRRRRSTADFQLSQKQIEKKLPTIRSRRPGVRAGSDEVRD